MTLRWKNILLIVGALVIGAAVIFLGPALVLTLASPDMCGNEVVAEYVSPDRAKKIVVFQRDCGATTGFSTQASLVNASEKAPTEGGNLFVADTDHGAAPAAAWGGPALAVRWLDPKLVILEHHARARVFKAEKLINGVAVRYTHAR
jgi:hypothetical protein